MKRLCCYCHISSSHTTCHTTSVSLSTYCDITMAATVTMILVKEVVNMQLHSGFWRTTTCITVKILYYKMTTSQLQQSIQRSLKQSMQLVHVSLSRWHNAVLGTQHGKVCYYSITHSSASSQGSHVSQALDKLPALPLQVWLTGLDEDGPPTPTSSSQPPQRTLLLLGGV